MNFIIGPINITLNRIIVYSYGMANVINLHKFWEEKKWSIKYTRSGLIICVCVCSFTCSTMSVKSGRSREILLRSVRRANSKTCSAPKQTKQVSNNFKDPLYTSASQAFFFGHPLPDLKISKLIAVGIHLTCSLHVNVTTSYPIFLWWKMSPKPDWARKTFSMVLVTMAIFSFLCTTDFKYLNIKSKCFNKFVDFVQENVQRMWK